MVNDEVLESLFGELAGQANDPENPFADRIKLLFKRYLDYLIGLRDDDKQIKFRADLLAFTLTQFQSSTYLNQENISKILRDIKNEGIEHKSLLVADEELINRLDRITNEISISHSPKSRIPASIKSGKTDIEKVLVNAIHWWQAQRPTLSMTYQGWVKYTLTQAIKKNKRDVFTAAITMVGPNKPTETTIDELLGIITAHNKWEFAKEILKMRGDNKLSKWNVDKTLAERTSECFTFSEIKTDVEKTQSNEDRFTFVQAILSMTGENRPTVYGVERRLHLSCIPNIHIDRTIETRICREILNMTGENKPTMWAIKEALVTAIEFNNYDSAKEILSLRGKNALTNEWVENVALGAVLLGKQDAVDAIIAIEGSNKPREKIVKLIDAIRNKNWKFIQDFLRESKPNCLVLDPLLVIVAKEGQLELVQQILEVEDENKPGSDAVCNALHEAISIEHIPMINLFLELKGDNSLQQHRIESILYMACEAKKFSSVQAILDMTGENKPSERSLNLAKLKLECHKSSQENDSTTPRFN